MRWGGIGDLVFALMAWRALQHSVPEYAGCRLCLVWLQLPPKKPTAAEVKADKSLNALDKALEQAGAGWRTLAAHHGVAIEFLYATGFEHHKAYRRKRFEQLYKYGIRTVLCPDTRRYHIVQDALAIALCPTHAVFIEPSPIISPHMARHERRAIKLSHLRARYHRAAWQQLAPLLTHVVGVDQLVTATRSRIDHKQDAAITASRVPHVLDHYRVLLETLCPHAVFDSWNAEGKDEAQPESPTSRAAQPSESCRAQNDYVLIVLGASVGERALPIRHVAAIVHHLRERQHPVVVTGLPQDVHAHARYYDANFLPPEPPVSSPPLAPVEHVSGSVIDLLERCRHAKAVMANDSGGIHLGVLAATPVYGMLVESFGNMAPFGTGFPYPSWAVPAEKQGFTLLPQQEFHQTAPLSTARLQAIATDIERLLT